MQWLTAIVVIFYSSAVIAACWLWKRADDRCDGALLGWKSSTEAHGVSLAEWGKSIETIKFQAAVIERQKQIIQAWESGNIVVQSSMPVCPECGEIYFSHPRLGISHACQRRPS